MVDAFDPLNVCSKLKLNWLPSGRNSNQKCIEQHRDSEAVPPNTNR